MDHECSVLQRDFALAEGRIAYKNQCMCDSAVETEDWDSLKEEGITSGWGGSAPSHFRLCTEPRKACVSKYHRELGKDLAGPIYWPYKGLYLNRFRQMRMCLSSIGDRKPSLEGDSVAFFINSFQYWAAKVVALTDSKHQNLLSLCLLNPSLPLYVREPLLYIWISHITALLVKQWVLTVVTQN